MQATTSRRFHALDGLRGLAALTVVLHHEVLLHPSLADAYVDRDDRAEGWVGLVIHSPLHLFWAGPQAVIVFFVLSGFVLTLAFLRAERRSWRVYYPSRLVRLYVPVWASVALAVVLLAAVERQVADGSSLFLAGYAVDYGPGAALGDLTLRHTSELNSPLWSLRLEVLFSLLLPAYLVVAVRLGRWAPLLAVGALVLTVVPVQDHLSDASYLAVFALGVLLAVRCDDVRAAVARSGRAGASALWAVALLATSATWWVPGPHALGQGLSVLGAVALVVVFLTLPSAQAVGGAAVVQWLGRRSFSLYLVHLPILATVAFALPGAGAVVWATLGIGLSLVAAAAFHALVETPAHRLARRAGRVFAAPTVDRGEHAPRLAAGREGERSTGGGATQ